MKVLVTGNDALVVDWTWRNFGVLCTKVDLAIGIVENKEMVGAAVFQAHNGPDIELSYYGPGTITLGIAKELARIAVDHFGVSRVTVRTARANKALARGYRKMGFVFEGIRHCAYGEQDAVMYGLFGNNLAKLAGKVMQ